MAGKDVRVTGGKPALDDALSDFRNPDGSVDLESLDDARRDAEADLEALRARLYRDDDGSKPVVTLTKDEAAVLLNRIMNPYKPVDVNDIILLQDTVKKIAMGVLG